MTARGRRFTIVLLALAAVGFAVAPALADSFKDANKALRRAVTSRDASAAKRAFGALADDNSKRSVKAILAVVAQARDLDVHEEMLAALVAHTNPGAIKYLAQQAKGHRDWTVRYLIVEALAAIDHDKAREALFKAYRDKHPLVAIGAMSASADNELVPSIAELIKRLQEIEKRPKGLERVGAAAIHALKVITGESFDDAFDWQSWWKVNAGRFNPEDVDRTGKDSKSSTVMRRIEKRGDQKFIEELAKGDIYCVTGSSDAVQNVLAALKLPHTVIERTSLASEVSKIPATAVIVFNCDGHQNELKADTVKALTAFVQRGGYMFTSDWELDSVLMKVAPGFVSVGKTAREQEVAIRPGPGALMHPYLRDVFPASPYEAAKFRWKIDAMSFTVTVGSKKVVPLVVSDELGKAYGSDVVAATYRYGKGSVLHVMSHFEKQTDPKGDGFALQQLFLNFVVEKQKFRRRRR